MPQCWHAVGRHVGHAAKNMLCANVAHGWKDGGHLQGSNLEIPREPPRHQVLAHGVCEADNHVAFWRRLLANKAAQVGPYGVIILLAIGAFIFRLKEGVLRYPVCLAHNFAKFDKPHSILYVLHDDARIEAQGQAGGLVGTGLRVAALGRWYGKHAFVAGQYVFLLTPCRNLI